MDRILQRALPLLIGAIFAVLAVNASAQPQSDDDIRKQSLAAYPGRCPCPYNLMSNGRRCGGRSAYSRPGGQSPYCYPSDVPQVEVDAYRRNHPH